MIALDTTQVQTLADGWGYETDDVDAAVAIADTLQMPLPVFIGMVDKINAGLKKEGCEDNPHNNCSYIMYCAARVAAGLPLD